MKAKDLIIYGSYPNFPVEGVNFIDLTPSLLDAKLTNELVTGLLELYVKDNDVHSKIDYIISPDARGFIWGSMVAQKYQLGFIPVRKVGKLPDDAILSTTNYDTEYSTTSLCLPHANIKDKKILFIDDVYATGGTYKAVKEMVEKNGGILLGGAVLIDIELDETEEIKSLMGVSEL